MAPKKPKAPKTPKAAPAPAEPQRDRSGEINREAGREVSRPDPTQASANNVSRQ